MNDMISYVEQEMIRLGLATPRPPQIVEVEKSNEPATIASNAKSEQPAEQPADFDPAERPTLKPDFIEPEWFGRFKLYMTGSKFHGACLFGPRGTGKTTATRQLAAQLNQRVIVFQCAGGMTIDDLIGVRDIRNGQTVFTPGPLTLAAIHDIWLVLEEANNLQTSVYASLNTLTDGSGTPLRTKDGKIYYPGKGFRVVLNYNEGSSYAGTREVNAALKDLLRPIYCKYMSESDETSMIQSRTGIDTTTASMIVRLANGCRDSIKSTGFDFSPRSMFAMIELVRELGCSWKSAFEWGILDMVGCPVEKATQRSVLANIATINGIDGWPSPVFDGQLPPPSPSPESDVSESNE